MLVQNSKNSTRSKVLSIVAIVLMAVTLVVVYLVYFYDSPEASLVNADQVLQRRSIDTTFPTEVLEDENVQQLRIYGPTEIKVQTKGGKVDPFLAF